MNLDRLVEEQKILVCCGSGGVGKTTLAAALAIEGALRNRRVLVLTIDPAKRLADSLGVRSLGNTVTRIPARKFMEVGENPEGSLSAMMLDTKSTFDELIERLGVREETKKTIMANRIYQNISDTLAGSQEYSAMEKLYEIHQGSEFDLIVLDTPPTQHALDFLEAPNRLTDFLEGRVAHLLIKPYLMAGKVSFRLVQRSTRIVLQALERVTGVEFLNDLSEFILSFDEMYDEFKERATRVKELLGQPETSFILVSSPRRQSVQESLFFYDKLIDGGMNVGAVVINRFHGLVDGKAGAEALAGARADDWVSALESVLGAPEPERDALRAFAAKLAENIERESVLAEIDRMNVASIDKLSGGLTIKKIPEFDHDIYDFGGLGEINTVLFGREDVETAEEQPA